MCKFSINKKIFTVTSSVVIALSAFIFSNANADQDTQKLVGGFGSTWYTTTDPRLSMSAKPDDKLWIATGNAQNFYLQNPTLPTVNDLTRDLLGHLYISSYDSATKEKREQDELNIQLSFKSILGNCPPALPNNPVSFVQNKICNALNQKPSDGFKNIDLNSVIKPLSYNPEEKKYAESAILGLAGTINPKEIVNFTRLRNLNNDPKKINDYLKRSDVQEYLGMLRNMVAIQSIAIGNLYQLYKEREPIDLDKADSNTKNAILAIINEKQNGKNPLGTDKPSSLQLENFMATRRITDENWYESLAKDNPAALQRQMIVLQAENLAELYHLRMTMERLLTTQSAMLLQNNLQAQTILQEKVKAIQNLANS